MKSHRTTHKERSQTHENYWKRVWKEFVADAKNFRSLYPQKKKLIKFKVQNGVCQSPILKEGLDGDSIEYLLNKMSKKSENINR